MNDDTMTTVPQNVQKVVRELMDLCEAERCTAIMLIDGELETLTATVGTTINKATLLAKWLSDHAGNKIWAKLALNVVLHRQQGRNFDKLNTVLLVIIICFLIYFL